MRVLGERLVHMPFSQSKFIKFQNGMRRRIDSLRPKAEESSGACRRYDDAGAGRQLLSC